jgi:hypothetical protein
MVRNLFVSVFVVFALLVFGLFFVLAVAYATLLLWLPILLANVSHQVFVSWGWWSNSVLLWVGYVAGLLVVERWVGGLFAQPRT